MKNGVKTLNPHPVLRHKLVMMDKAMVNVSPNTFVSTTLLTLLNVFTKLSDTV